MGLTHSLYIQYVRAVHTAAPPIHRHEASREMNALRRGAATHASRPYVVITTNAPRDVRAQVTLSPPGHVFTLVSVRGRIVRIQALYLVTHVQALLILLLNSVTLPFGLSASVRSSSVESLFANWSENDVKVEPSPRTTGVVLNDDAIRVSLTREPRG